MPGPTVPARAKLAKLRDWLSDWERRLPPIVVITLVLFILFSAASAFHLANVSEPYGPRDSLYAIGPFVAFVALTLAFSAWFIACFTGDVTAERQRQGFRFAYAFTITAFVILMIPVANPWQPDVIGPISLVRGCVLAPADNEAAVPGAIRCTRNEIAMLPPAARRGFFSATGKPDGGLDGQSTDQQEQEAKAAANTSSGAASAGGTSDAGGQTGATAASEPHPGERICNEDTAIANPCIEGHSYPWLVTLGGFNGIVIHERRLLDGQPAAAVAQPSSAAVPAAPAKDTPRPPYMLRASIIQGGFVVPFYVVLLAFVGGAVSLARRIPEYQKRSTPGYESTLKQPVLKDSEVREVVVFQIMQLVCAPFVAIVAFYALAPSTMSSAIGLAFLSGFSSELILLQVRGVIDGLQPHSTAMTNPANKPSEPEPTGTGGTQSPSPAGSSDGGSQSVLDDVLEAPAEGERAAQAR